MIHQYQVKRKLTLTSYILSTTDHGCSTVLHLRLLRVEEQEESLVNINTLNKFPRAFAHARDRVEHAYVEQLLI